MAECFYCEKDNEKRKALMLDVCELPYSIVYLFRDQKNKGRCVVAFKGHKTEYFQLTPEENAGYFADVAKVAKVLDELYHPDKINYATYGDGMEMDAIASSVIGGTLMSGGVAFLPGTLLGVLIQGVIQTFITFQGTLSAWWTRIIIALLLCLFCAVPAFAEMPLVMDTYELFKPEVTAELEQKAQDASAGHGVNVYLLTVADIGGQNVREFAKDWYRSNDLGYGEGKSGILFLIALDSRDYVTITYGGGVTAFTDYRIAQIEDKIVPMLSDGSYYKASDTYIEMCADTLDFYAEKGAPLDSGNDPAKGWIKWVFVFVIPLAVASIVCGIFYAQMKTANEQTHANAYMPAEGLALSVVEDTYTHTTETERYDPVKNDSSSSSSGSSTDSDGFGGSSGGKF